MSQAPERIRPRHRPSPVAETGHRAEVIEISPGLTSRLPMTTDHDADTREETVVLGGAFPHGSGTATPPRFRHLGRLLSSVVIAAGGVLAVVVAGTAGNAPVVARVALLATVFCGVLLVAAQVTDEVRRSRGRTATR